MISVKCTGARNVHSDGDIYWNINSLVYNGTL